jgi:putative inorganic carbon (HCO3(-)) transporter
MLRVSSTLLFATTALIGLFVAYDPHVGLGRFALILLGLALAGLLALVGRLDPSKTAVGYLAYGLLWAAALLGVAHLLSGGLVSQSGGIEFAWRLNNGMGGALAALIPIGFSALLWLAGRWRSAGQRAAGVLAFAGVIPLSAALIALVATGSRGALVGMAAGGAVALYLAWRATAGQTASLRWLGDLLLALAALGVAAGFLFVLFAPNSLEVIQALTRDASATSRPALWRDSLALIQDYRYTGSGLGGAGMIFSTYLFLLHVGFLYHAHNLYLQIALEQGLPGLIAFGCMAAATLWMAARALRPGRAANVLVCGAIAALVALLLHGLVEAELYATALTPLLFLPFGFAWALQPVPQDERDSNDRQLRPVVAVIAGATPVLLVLLLFALPGARAAFQANLGALSQTQAELARYSWPQWPIQDALRRDPTVDLTGAVTRYEAALQLDPDNVTALRRLGQIELSRGEIKTAQTHLERAYALAPAQRPTRQLLGEVYALTGDAERAAELWATVETDQGQLDLRRWWTAQTGTQAEVVGLVKAINRLHEIQQNTEP